MPCQYGLNCWSRYCRYQHPLGWNPHSKAKPVWSPPKSQGGPLISPKSDLEPNFYVGTLRLAEAKGFRAAGILLMRRSASSGVTKEPLYEARSSSLSPSSSSLLSSVQVLLCAEVRKKKQNLELNLLGGKVEPHDGQDSRITAAREFWEETGRFVPLSTCQRLVGIASEDDNHSSMPKAATPIWCGPGKYVLYAASLLEDDCAVCYEKLPEHFFQASRANSLPPGAEPDFLVWVDWDLIQQQPGGERQESFTFWVPSDTESERTSLSLQLSRFTKSMLNNAVLQQGVLMVINDLESKGTSNAMNTVTTALNEMNLQGLEHDKL
jgi:8-oxo-dGTP pyrophosphatase MutT (NUDIX family)